MLADQVRGGAWTRALLGVPAHEVHVCGEPGAVELIKQMMSETKESVEVRLSSSSPSRYHTVHRIMHVIHVWVGGGIRQTSSASTSQLQLEWVICSCAAR